jgi:diaminopimelate epimerase
MYFIVSDFHGLVISVMHEIHFTKASGAGNDFVIVDNRRGTLPHDQPELARRLCSRHFGIGADGLLVLEESAHSDFLMKYYNADGSHGGMCGNGGRCIARYAYLNGVAPEEMSFEALDFVYRAVVDGERVRLTMKDPSGFKDAVEPEVAGRKRRGYFVNTGSPHYVEFVPDVNAIDVGGLGPAIRNDRLFYPEGTNVDFVQVGPGSTIMLRTYERGVERETLACGTGAVAAAIVSHFQRQLSFPVTVRVRSGESLTVRADSSQGKVTSPTLEGSAHILFQGKLNYDSSESKILDYIRP